tara:strand:- start:1552 stop:1725 length:174 start_codon:yes stop_codon:yes gene_type:complete
MTKINLFFIAILGSAFAFSIINLFIVDITIIQFITIELIISGLHALYNLAKKEALNS